MKELFFFITMSVCVSSCSQGEVFDLVIENISIFDSKSKLVIPNQTIFIQADTIAAIGISSTKYSAKKTIQGNGRLLTPGFIDTHTHMKQNYRYSENSDPEYIPEDEHDLLRNIQSHHYLNHGVTTIIDMGQPETWMDLSLSWQNDPNPKYPNFFICGGSIVSDDNYRQPSHHIEVMNPEDGRQKVRDYAKRGLKYMKLYRKLRKPDMEAMVDEALKHNIIVNTHVDNNVVTIDEAMDFGILNFEHFFTLVPSILNYDEHWPKMNDKYGIQMNSSIDEFSAHMVFFFSYIRENPEFEKRLFSLFDRMAAKGATISTAINVLASAAQKTDFFTSFEYFPIRRSPKVNYTEAQKGQLEYAFESMMHYVKIAHEKGVKIRIGTDCRFGGESLLRECILFEKAGIPITEILQIATLSGYESMKLEREYGTVEVGKKADLVLFEKNPLEDIQNVLSKKTIIKGGKLFESKRSMAYDLLEIMIDKGPQEGLEWHQKTIGDPLYATMDKKELLHVTRQLLGTGMVAQGKQCHAIYKELFPKSQMNLDGNWLINCLYSVIREKDAKEAIDFYKYAKSNFPVSSNNLPLAVMISILEGGSDNGVKTYEKIKDNPDSVYNEDEMNGVGYLLLQKDMVSEAIEVFKINVGAFPNSWNVYDSLAEGYMTNGDHPLAIKNYEKSLVLNPENEYGKEQLVKLRKL